MARRHHNHLKDFHRHTPSLPATKCHAKFLPDTHSIKWKCSTLPCTILRPLCAPSAHLSSSSGGWLHKLFEPYEWLSAADELLTHSICLAATAGGCLETPPDDDSDVAITSSRLDKGGGEWVKCKWCENDVNFLIDHDMWGRWVVVCRASNRQLLLILTGGNNQPNTE